MLDPDFYSALSNSKNLKYEKYLKTYKYKNVISYKAHNCMILRCCLL